MTNNFLEGRRAPVPSEEQPDIEGQSSTNSDSSEHDGHDPAAAAAAAVVGDDVDDGAVNLPLRQRRRFFAGGRLRGAPQIVTAEDDDDDDQDVDVESGGRGDSARSESSATVTRTTATTTSTDGEQDPVDETMTETTLPLTLEEEWAQTLQDFRRKLRIFVLLIVLLFAISFLVPDSVGNVIAGVIMPVFPFIVMYFMIKFTNESEVSRNGDGTTGGHGTSGTRRQPRTKEEIVSKLHIRTLADGKASSSIMGTCAMDSNDDADQTKISTSTSAPSPVNKKRRSSSGVHKYETLEAQDDNFDDDYEECCDICQELYADGDIIASSPNKECRHYYHRDCIVEWLIANDDCPACRRAYLKRSDDEEENKGFNSIDQTTTTAPQQQSAQVQVEAQVELDGLEQGMEEEQQRDAASAFTDSDPTTPEDVLDHDEDNNNNNNSSKTSIGVALV